MIEALPNAVANDYHATTGLDEAAIVRVQAHGGDFPVDAEVCIEAPNFGKGHGSVFL